MIVEKDPSLGLTSVWLSHEEQGTDEAADIIDQLKDRTAPGEKVVVFISGTRPAEDCTCTLLKSQIIQARGRGA